MEAKAKAFGHPVHPMLIVFPLGLLATAVIFDLITLFSGNTQWTGIAYWMIAAGIAGGLLAAVFGLIDFLAIPSGTRARSIGLIHGVGNVLVVALFAGSWLLRTNDPYHPRRSRLCSRLQAWRLHWLRDGSVASWWTGSVLELMMARI